MTEPTAPFTAQPYPLFYAEYDNDTFRTGRIIGWINVGTPTNGQPVVLFNNPDGSINTLGYAEPDQVQFSWISDTLAAVVADAEKTLGSDFPFAGIPPALVTIATIRRGWAKVASRVSSANQRAGRLTRDATIVGFDGTTVTTFHRNSIEAQALDKYTEMIRDALHEELGGWWEVRVEASIGSASQGRP